MTSLGFTFLNLVYNTPFKSMNLRDIAHQTLFQTSLLSVLNLIVQELEPKAICLSLNGTNHGLDLTFDVPTVAIDCSNDDFFEVYKQGIGLGCYVSTVFVRGFLLNHCLVVKFRSTLQRMTVL